MNQSFCSVSYDTLVCLLLLCFYIIASNLFLSFELIRSYVQKIYPHCTCTALPRVEFLSNPRRIHSEEEDEEKEERGLPRALVCCSTASPSPSPSPPPHTLRACWIAWGCVIRTHPPLSKYILMGQNQWFSGKAAKKYDSLCSTTGKPMRSFATERVSLDSV